MNVNVTSTFKSMLRFLFSRKVLPIISLFFITTIAFTQFTPDTNATWLPKIDAVVETEVELVNAINAAPDGEGYLIYVLNSIKLEKSLEIPKDKLIDLVGSGPLFGADGKDTIIVRSGGRLNLFWDIPISHVEGESGRGVYVERGGVLFTNQAEISGNSADKGGGVYNEGELEITTSSVIANNTATKGGGVYNKGNFTLMSSEVCRNNCTDTLFSVGVGGGVYNEGNFTIQSGYVRYNVAAKGGDVYSVGIYEGPVSTGVWGNDVLIETKGSGPVYLLFISVAAIVCAVAGLFVYRSKRRKPSVVNELADSIVV